MDKQLIEIEHLADDIDLEGHERKQFISEMLKEITTISKNDWDKFYNIADVVMQKYYKD